MGIVTHSLFQLCILLAVKALLQATRLGVQAMRADLGRTTGSLIARQATR